MDKKTMRRLIIGLILASVVIYLLQILIFHDSRNTFFYIFQDFAFLPVSVAIATLVVGEFLGAREKRERLEKTRMLTSTFFTMVGAYLLKDLIAVTNHDEFTLEVVRNGAAGSGLTEAEIKEKALKEKFSVHINAATYTKIRQLLNANQTNLMVIASNPLILEHECFTEMLWGVFHLLDEFRLRGSWDDLSKEDINHFNHDFEEVLHLLLANWIGNTQYLSETYPAFYTAASGKILDKV